MRTEAIVCQSPGAAFQHQTLYLDDVPRDDEVHVRIYATGICHTDVIFSKEDNLPDQFPGVFGHEGAGVVQSVGPGVSTVKEGDHVICVFSCCGECAYCERRETGYCDYWFQLNFGVGRLDGSKAFTDKSGRRVTGHFFGQSSFARDVYVKQTGLVVVPLGTGVEELGWEMLAPLACGVMTGAGAMLHAVMPHVQERFGGEAGSGGNVAVVGTGSVGLSAIMALGLLEKRERPRRVIAVDVVPARLELARDCGATHGVNSSVRKDLMNVLMEITAGEGVHGVIDTTGRKEVLEALIHACARKGKVVTVGTGGTKGMVEVSMFEMVQAGCTYVGCQQGDCYPQDFLPKLLKANAEGKFPYEKLIRTYPAKNVQKAIDDMESGKTIKPVLIWN